MAFADSYASGDGDEGDDEKVVGRFPARMQFAISPDISGYLVESSRWRLCQSDTAARHSMRRDGNYSSLPASFSSIAETTCSDTCILVPRERKGGRDVSR